MNLVTKSLFAAALTVATLIPKLALADTCAMPGTAATGAPSISVPLVMVAFGLGALFILRRKP